MHSTLSTKARRVNIVQIALEATQHAPVVIPPAAGNRVNRIRRVAAFQRQAGTDMANGSQVPGLDFSYDDSEPSGNRYCLARSVRAWSTASFF
ncbi:hypothetical protein MRX96_036486 [Rhipicephalus microplus]